MFSITYRDRWKRLLDLIVVVLASIFLLPLIALIALAVRLTSRGPIFFAQTRVGKDGRLFQSYKFRSMYLNDIDPSTTGEVLADNPLVTPVGRIIRRLKIDELPQIWNIINGDMSLIGPRPTIPEHIEGYTPEQYRRLDVIPGLTGWAQVNGNIELSWDQRIQLDLYYIDHQSFWLDLKILWLTIDVVLHGEHPRAEALNEAGIRWSS